MNLSDLDSLMAAEDMPIRPETLAQAWDTTGVLEPTAMPAGQVLILVTLRARSGEEERLEAAAQEFVEATSSLSGALGSSLHRSPEHAETWYLLERFANQDSFAAHMASDYFRRFQLAQEPLLSEPVLAHFLQR